MLFSTLRFVARGFVGSQLLEPALRFHYFGFSWVEPLPGYGMYAVFAVMALAALGVALGRFYRPSILVFLVCFVYAELCEKATYLNHYYLATLLALLLACMPATKRRVPRYTLLVLRCQLGLVYFFA